MKTYFLSSLRLTLICIVVFVGLYGTLVWGIAIIAAPNHGKTEFLERDGKIIGAANVGQKFSSDRYFWGRPSAVDYNAAGSAGSNKSASNPDYLKIVQERIDTLLVHNPGLKKDDIPSDMVCASGSGLDPHISPQGARIQIERIVKVRNLDKSKVSALVESHIETPFLGIFGTYRVHVLKLNLALDQL